MSADAQRPNAKFSVVTATVGKKSHPVGPVGTVTGSPQGICTNVSAGGPE
jgi:hypothetical protein